MAQSAGIGAVLYHRYEDGSERHIANVSQDVEPDTAQLESNTERSFSFALHVPPVSVWAKVHSCDRSQALDKYVCSTKSYPQISC